MDSGSEKSAKLEVNKGHTVDKNDVDVAAQLTAGSDFAAIDPEVALRLRRKIDWHLMPLMCLMYLMTFADKTTLGQSAVLGLIPDNHLNQNQFNWLGCIFYLSYLVFEYPQNLALQRLPVAKYMSINIFVWSVALLSHAACSSFGGLFACRFILGICEGAITPGFLIVTSMFYTREEQTRRVGLWYLMNGFAIIFLGLVSFGLLHIKHPSFMAWQWLMIITGIITFITSILFWFFFPDSPTSARFLTPEERVLAVQRIKVNQAGVENKHWKKEQFIETLLDPKTWLMAFFAAMSNIVNSLTNQRQLIVNEFGFTVEQTTLLGCVDGAIEIITISVGVALATSWKNSRAYAIALLFVPAILGAILVNALPTHNRVGLLLTYYVSIFAVAPFAIFLGWIGSIVSGHTKRTTLNAIVLCAYAIANAAAPFMWKKQYQPRNHVPWAIITVCSFVSGVTILALRVLLARENAARAKEAHDATYDNMYVTVVEADGSVAEKKVDKAFLDLTDIQNRDFRYVL